MQGAKKFIGDNKEMLIGGLGGGLLGGGSAYMLTSKSDTDTPSTLLKKRINAAITGALLGGATGAGAGYIYKQTDVPGTAKKIVKAIEDSGKPNNEDKGVAMIPPAAAAGGAVVGATLGNKVGTPLGETAGAAKVRKFNDILTEATKAKYVVQPGDSKYYSRLAAGAEKEFNKALKLYNAGKMSDFDFKPIAERYAARTADQISAKRGIVPAFAKIREALAQADVNRAVPAGNSRAKIIKTILTLLGTGGGIWGGYELGDAIK